MFDLFYKTHGMCVFCYYYCLICLIYNIPLVNAYVHVIIFKFLVSIFVGHLVFCITKFGDDDLLFSEKNYIHGKPPLCLFYYCRRFVFGIQFPILARSVFGIQFPIPGKILRKTQHYIP